jgi:hypothetical protein
MSAPCPFCGFAASDYRESHNWRCAQCGKDYAAWLTIQKAAYALGQHAVYTRDKSPIMYKAHLWGVIVYMILAFVVSVD